VLFVDVDECNSTETDNCPADTVCVNTYGTYFCVSGVTLGHSLSLILSCLFVAVLQQLHAGSVCTCCCCVGRRGEGISVLWWSPMTF